MESFNAGRWLTGGLLAGLVIWLLEGALGGLYAQEMSARLAELGLAMDMSARHLVGSLASTALVGLVMLFLYAVLRAPLGPGPRTALVAGLLLFIGGYVPGLVGYHLLGLFRPGLLLHWGAQGLVEMLLAALAGAALYRPRAGAR